MTATYTQLLDRAWDENVLNSVLLELTYGCNLDCAFCYNDLNLRGQRVSLDRYKALLDELADMRVISLTLTGGEPLLYRHFFELGAYARAKGFVTRVKSNGVPLNRRNAERLRNEVDPFMVEVSLHGATPQTHDRQTQVPGSFERLLRNLGTMREVGLRVKINSALTIWNEHETDAIYALANELGVPLQFDPQITPRDDGDLSPLKLSPSREGVEHMFRLTARQAVAARAGDRLPLQLKPAVRPEQPPARTQHKICGAGSMNLTIDPFGNVYPCVQFRRKAGNIHHQTIRDIWRGSGVLEEVRTLAETALEVARSAGLSHFCMGINELRTGDPLQPTASKREIDRIYQRIEWESETGTSEAPPDT